MWDIGGQEAIRPYWKNYYDNTDGLVYVVDSTDDMRTEEASKELQGLLGEEQLNGVPLLVFANKQDLELAQDSGEIMEALDLEGIKDRNWNIQACSAFTKNGLSDGMEWLIKVIGER